jgi:hypothetical protein
MTWISDQNNNESVSNHVLNLLTTGVIQYSTPSPTPTTHPINEGLQATEWTSFEA